MVGFPTYNFIYDLRVSQVTRSLKLNRGPSIPSRTDHLAISEMSVAAGVDPTVMVSATTSGSRYTERQRVTHHTKFNRTQHTPCQGRTRLQTTEHHNYEIGIYPAGNVHTTSLKNYGVLERCNYFTLGTRVDFTALYKHHWTCGTNNDRLCIISHPARCLSNIASMPGSSERHGNKEVGF